LIIIFYVFDFLENRNTERRYKIISSTPTTDDKISINKNKSTIFEKHKLISIQWIIHCKYKNGKLQKKEVKDKKHCKFLSELDPKHPSKEVINQVLEFCTVHRQENIEYNYQIIPRIPTGNEISSIEKK